jgi:outer membrane protein OmpA-like peptidoglycan-associated protein
MAEMHDGTEGGPWPAFADLLGATTLLFLILFAAVAIPAMRRAGMVDARESTLETLKREVTEGTRSTAVDVQVVGDYLLVRIEGDATFGLDQFELRDLKQEGRGILRDLGASLRRDSVLTLIDQVQVVGHTSREGTDERNWRLSSTRAASVALFLIDSARIPACKVSALGRSRYYPVDPAAAARDAGAVDERDRRIELEIRPVVVGDTLQEQRRSSCVDREGGA